MSEGGYLLWKRQKLRIPPTANYSDIKKPISLPPGKTWCRDLQTNEWKVVDLVPLSSSIENVDVCECQGSGDTSNGLLTSQYTGSSIIAEADVVGMQELTATATATDAMNAGNFIPTAHAITVMHKDNDADAEDNNDNDTKKDTQDDGLFHHHTVQPNDTLAGICLRYRITPTELRRSNMFSGSNLALAPTVLRIPKSSTNNVKMIQQHQQQYQQQKQHVSDPKLQDKQSKIQLFCSTLDNKLSMARSKVLGKQEAVAYLEMNGWNVQEAVWDALQDWKWEQSKH